MGRKKEEIDTVSADAITVDDAVWIYGNWLKVIRITQLNRHPIQLREFYFEEFREPIRVPAGWKIERRK